MSAKKIKVIVLQGLKHEGGYPPLGSEVSLDAAEAKRLLALGVVDLPRQSAPEKTDPDAELIERIEAAATRAELEALMPETAPSKTVKAAFATRWDALGDSQS